MAFFHTNTAIFIILRWEIRGPEKVHQLPKVTQPVESKAWVWDPGSVFQRPCLSKRTDLPKSSAFLRGSPLPCGLISFRHFPRSHINLRTSLKRQNLITTYFLAPKSIHSSSFFANPVASSITWMCLVCLGFCCWWTFKTCFFPVKLKLPGNITGHCSVHRDIR